MQTFTVEITRVDEYRSRVRLVDSYGKAIATCTKDISSMGMHLAAHLRLSVDQKLDAMRRDRDYRQYLKSRGDSEAASSNKQYGRIRLKDERGEIDIPLSSKCMREIDKCVARLRRMRRRRELLDRRLPQCTTAD